MASIFGKSTTTASPFSGLGATSTTNAASAFGQPATTTASNTNTASTAFGSGLGGGGLSLGGSTLGGSTAGVPGILKNPLTQEQQQQNISNLNSSMFGQGPGASILGQPAASTAPATAPAAASTTTPQPTGAFFDSLLAKNKKQAEGESAFGELPSLQLGLGDLRQRLKKLNPRTQDRPVDGKVHYLLAAAGVDPGAAVRDLGTLGISGRGAAGGERGGAGWNAGELDVETYLSNLQTKTTLSMIADGLDRSVRDFDSFLEDNVTMEWEAQRRRIYHHFGIKPKEDTSRSSGGAAAGRDAQGGGFGRSRRTGNQSTPGRSTQKSAFGRSSMQKSVLGTPSRIGSHASEFTDVEPAPDTTTNAAQTMDERFRREKQVKLAEQIQSLNNARQGKMRFYLCNNLAQIEEKSGDKHGPQLMEAYRALMEIVGEQPEQDAAPRERQFAKMYLDPNNQSENAISMRKRILKGANRFLEMQFFSEVQSMIAKHPTEANLGGRPDVVSKIKAYIRVLISRKSLVPDNTELQQVNGEYVWAVVFYLLRAGFVSEAATYVNDNQNHFRSIDRTFSGYMFSYASSEDRRLKRAMQERCTAEYNQRVRNAPEGSIDPFRMACYKIIGRCDISNRSLDGLQTDVKDWVWLQFNLAREIDRTSELASEMYGLAELQTSINEIGLKYFPKNPSEDTNGSFGMFFFLQILSGMFEKAIAYLYPFSYVDAVHFAIALEYYGLLRPADPQTTANELQSFNTRGLPQINFGRMIGYYTRDFRAANVGAAVDYLALICLNADDSGGEVHATLCHEALRELVLETREFSKLIGDIKPDGHRIRGIIEERGPLIALSQERNFMEAITLQAAGFADDNGRTTDAVLLYHLAEDYDNVVAIVSRALSEAISLEMGEDPMRLLPVKPRVDGPEAAAQPGSSLSLAAIDDPVELARTMMTMYERDRMFWQKIREPNRVACGVLLQMSEIKSLVEAGKWPLCLDKISALDIIPLAANGDPSIIRNYASKFSSLAQPVAINVPNLLMWSVICCTQQRERLSREGFHGNEATAKMMMAELKQKCVDLTTYTSQLRYRFPPHLHEALARASAD